MILKTKGKTQNISKPIVGRITRFVLNDEYEILITDKISDLTKNIFKAVLTSDVCESAFDQPLIHSIVSVDHFKEGDIVVLNTDGVINTLYRVNSFHNFMLFTERCNSNCLMCSQPPKDKDDTDYYYQLFKEMIPLVPKDCYELGITGGEPTLLGSRFFHLLELLKENLPDTDIHCLTNGRAFAWDNVSTRLGGLSYDRLMLGVPVYSDVYHLHDYIVQAKDAFEQTMKGLYNLAKVGQRLELRVVLHQQTIPRLKKLANFIYKNLPFVEHVAFMGLEHQGYTPYNIEKLWIDPIEYQSELNEAVTLLSEYGMNVSIYNAQLCTLPNNLWKFARKSISDWKNVYLDECCQCIELERCGGLFASGLKKHSIHIKAIV